MYKVCIDPGHGGTDRKNIGISGKYIEADGVLFISNEVIKLLRQHKEFEIVPTRVKDETVSLVKRCEIANKAAVNLFVSIHSNANANQAANGIETFCHKKGGQGEVAAKFIQEELIKELKLRDRGVTEGQAYINGQPIYVLKNTNMPAALTEVGFHTNIVEEKLLLTDEFKLRAAKAIYRAICRYFKVNPIENNDQKKEDNEVESLKNTITQLRTQVEGLQKTNTTLTTTNAALAANNEQLNRNVKTLQDKIDKINIILKA